MFPIPERPPSRIGKRAGFAADVDEAMHGKSRRALLEAGVNFKVVRTLSAPSGSGRW